MTEYPEDVLQTAREAAADTVHPGHADILRSVYLAGDKDDHAVCAAARAVTADRTRHSEACELPRARGADTKDGWVLSCTLLDEVSSKVQEEFGASPSWDEIELIMLEAERRIVSALVRGSLEGGSDENQ